jgi:Fe2+ or Zn2+ uptake regulation protein
MQEKTKYHSINRDLFESIIKSYPRPFTAKNIIDASYDESPLSTTTVYRLLDEYEKNGLLRKELGEDGSAIYYYLEPCPSQNHLLLECSVCHNIFHIDCNHLKTFAKHISKKHNFQISNYQLIIQGVCDDCKEEI